MGKINLVRVDDRLIHGQVMTKWSKGLGTNAIYVVDNMTAADDFLKEIYINANSSSGLRIKVFSTSQVIESWDKDQFGNDNAILLFKNIASVKEVLEKGNVPIGKLNIGGISKKANSKFVISTVGLTIEDGEILKEMAEKGIEIYFQTVPESKRLSLNDALKALK